WDAAAPFCHSCFAFVPICSELGASVFAFTTTRKTDWTIPPRRLRSIRSPRKWKEPAMREIISPNLHVVLMHTPLALLVIGTVIELFAFLWRESTFRTAGRWMILLGALAMIP